MTTVIIVLIALTVYNIINSIFIVKNAKRINKLGGIHNHFVDVTNDMYDDLVKQINDRIDMTNDQFHRIDNVLEDVHEIF